MQVLVFTNGHKRPTIPLREGLTIRYISFDTSSLDDLLMIARFRIVTYPTSLIIDNRGKVLLKMHGSVPASYINNLSGGTNESLC
jgi:hypothetical protein